MGRLVTAALLVAALLGGLTVALGGVEVAHEDEAPRRAERRVAPVAAAQPPTAGREARGPIGARVEMRRLAFTRPRVTVDVGEAVRWTNRDGAEHDVFAEGLSGNGSPPFASAKLSPGSSFTATFRAPGTYRYTCTLHPSAMSGAVTVTRG